jgi:hypothetical protein
MSLFFADALSPLLPLRLSPLRNIFLFLEDAEINSICHTNREFQSLFPQSHLTQYRRVSDWRAPSCVKGLALGLNDWKRIQQSSGPILTAVWVHQLTDLKLIPSDQRIHIRTLLFDVLEEDDEVKPEWIPPLLEGFCSEDGPTDAARMRLSTLPSLPSTLRKFSLTRRS